MGTGEWVMIVVGALAIGFLLGVWYTTWVAEKTIDRINQGYAALIRGYTEATLEMKAGAKSGGEESPAP